MKELANNILAQIEVDISEIDLYGYNIIDVSLSIVHRLQTALNDLRMKIQTYIFPTKEDEILFFKTQKPEILGRLLFFYKIYKIETQCPNGSDEVIRNYINRELDNLQRCFKYPFRFTGKKSYLIELGYSLVSSGDINNGNVEIKEMMNFLSTIFHIDLGDYYASYIAMKERKDRTAYLHHLIDNLVKRMNEDDMEC